MRIFVSIVLAFAASSAMAFDSAKWLEKREFLTREVERLQAAYRKCSANINQPAEDVTVPLETFDDGSVKSVVHANRAQYFMKEGLVWAEGVIVKKFKPDGSLDARIDAQSCIIDRFTKSGWSEGPTKVEHKSTVFTGNGVYFSSPEGYVKIVKDSDVVSKDLKFGGMRP